MNLRHGVLPAPGGGLSPGTPDRLLRPGVSQGRPPDRGGGGGGAQPVDPPRLCHLPRGCGRGADGLDRGGLSVLPGQGRAGETKMSRCPGKEAPV